MIGLPARRFARDAGELAEMLTRIKQVACPHCGRVEALIGHGFLRGYEERGSGVIVRGRRFFCSNRHRRPGCGRTFSVLLAHLLSRCIVSARLLYEFLVGLVGDSCSTARAWRDAAGKTFCLQTGYRHLRRFGRCELALRAFLLQRCPPPAMASAEPRAQLLAHLRCALPDASCPLAELQLTLDRPLVA